MNHPAVSKEKYHLLVTYEDKPNHRDEIIIIQNFTAH